MSIRANKLISTLIMKNFRFFASVPDTLLVPYLDELQNCCNNNINHVSALREDVAIGIAAGSVMSGTKSVILMQNSGLGISINSLSSLILPFKIPILMIIGYRGFKGQDTEEHLIMGDITLDLLNKLNIATRLLDQDNSIEIASWAAANIENGNCVAILIPPPDIN